LYLFFDAFMVKIKLKSKLFQNEGTFEKVKRKNKKRKRKKQIKYKK